MNNQIPDLLESDVTVYLPVFERSVTLSRAANYTAYSPLYDSNNRQDLTLVEPGDPISRALRLTQGGRLNRFCLTFRISSGSSTLVEQEGWGDTPQEAAHKLSSRLQTIRNIIRWG